MDFEFTWSRLQSYYEKALDLGYEIWTCEEYALRKSDRPNKLIVNRIDIDFSVKKASRLLDIYKKLGIKASFFVRLHAPEYNPFDFENYRVLKRLISEGHELGYHSEIIDQAMIWGESAEVCLIRDVAVLNQMFGADIKGVASHGGMTGLNNLDFWANRHASDYGLLYEAYDKSTFDLFDNSFYISDSEWSKWKCYKNGKLCEGDRRSFGQHLDQEHDLVYLLIHSDTYFDKHFYE